MSQLRAPLRVPVFELHSGVGVSWCSVLLVSGDGPGLALGPTSAAAYHPSRAARGASRMMGMTEVTRRRRAATCRGRDVAAQRANCSRACSTEPGGQSAGGPSLPDRLLSNSFLFLAVLPCVVWVQRRDSVRTLTSASLADLPGSSGRNCRLLSQCMYESSRLCGAQLSASTSLAD